MSTASLLFAAAFLLASRVMDTQAQSLVYPDCPSSWSWVRRPPPFKKMPVIDPEECCPRRPTHSARAPVLSLRTCRVLVMVEVRQHDRRPLDRQIDCSSVEFTIPMLGSGNSYTGPTGSGDDDDLCKCNTVVYSLMSACDACQGAKWFTCVHYHPTGFLGVSISSL
jgi:hypothetical protein